MRAAVAAMALLLVACAPTPNELPDGVGVPIDQDVVDAAVAADIEACPDTDGRTALRGVAVTCLATGAPMALELADGIPTVVNVWASWCEPCREEIPLLARAARDFDGKVAVIGVVFADAQPGEAVALLQDSGATYPQFVDVSGDSRADFRLRGLPQTAFFDETGAMVGTEHTPFESYADVLGAIEDHLGVSP